MKRWRLSSKARTDLDQIWRYSKSHWDEDQAELYLRAIKDAIGRIASDQVQGRPFAAGLEGYLRYSVHSHVVFYRQGLDSLEVIRILHRRMDFDRHL